MSNTPFYESFLSRHFPAWAARRAEARGVSDLMASYRGGVATRLSQAWGTSTSYEFGTSTDRLRLGGARDRARKVYRDNPIGRTLVETEADNVIGDGFNLTAQTESEDFNREAEERWYEWLEVADVRGLFSGADMQRMPWIRSRVDGDFGVVLVDRGGESRLQMVPGDLICTPDGKSIGPLPGGNFIADGVEFNRVGRPVAFHVLETNEYGKRAWQRIGADNFIFLPHLNEPNGARGETCYLTVFHWLDELDRYIDGVALAAHMATVFGLIIKDTTAARQYSSLPTSLTNSRGESQKALTLENGMVKYLGTEGDVLQVDAKQPMQQTPDFIRAMMRLIGMPFHMPLEVIGKDMSTCNFSSARIGLLGFYRHCRVKQAWFVSRMLTRVYRWWISREVKSGRFMSAAPEDFWPHEFLGNAWDYTDPVSEAQSDLLQIDMGTKTREMVIAERGRNIRAIDEQRQREMDRELPQVHSTMTRDSVEPAEDPEQPENENPDDEPENDPEPSDAD